MKGKVELKMKSSKGKYCKALLSLFLVFLFSSCSAEEGIQFAHLDAVFGDYAQISGGTGGNALINIQSGEEIIPMGEFNAITHVQDGLALVGIWEQGSSILNLETGETLIPFGVFNRIYGFHSRGVAIVGENRNGEIGTFLSDRIALIDLETGEERIPFGVFNLFRPNEDMRWAVVRCAEGGRFYPAGVWLT